MKYKNIEITNKNYISVITINRPKFLNALNIATIQELSKALLNIEKNKEIRCVIITGQGNKSFVAGADIKEFSNFTKKEAFEMSKNGQKNLFDYIECMRTPVISAVNGYALGGGLELALASHIRIFSENAKVGLPEVSLGLIPGYGGTQRLSQLCGKGIALKMILSAEIIDAKTALKYGITNLVVNNENLILESKKLAKQICNNSPNSIGNAIESINACFNFNLDGFEYEIEKFSDCFNSSDFREGASAFMEKRKPTFN